MAHLRPPAAAQPYGGFEGEREQRRAPEARYSLLVVGRSLTVFPSPFTPLPLADDDEDDGNAGDDRGRVRGAHVAAAASSDGAGDEDPSALVLRLMGYRTGPHPAPVSTTSTPLRAAAAKYGAPFGSLAGLLVALVGREVAVHLRRGSAAGKRAREAAAASSASSSSSSASHKRKREEKEEEGGGGEDEEPPTMVGILTRADATMGYVKVARGRGRC
jgi:hypothetical protein